MERARETDARDGLRYFGRALLTERPNALGPLADLEQIEGASWAVTFSNCTGYAKTAVLFVNLTVTM